MTDSSPYGSCAFYASLLKYGLRRNAELSVKCLVGYCDIMDKNFVLGDSDIRLFLRSKLLLKHAKDMDTVVIEELGLCRGQVRVDISVVNGFLHGYEIKSDKDSLHRLQGQVDLYGKVLDRATLVVGHRHLAEALDLVPIWWGVLLVHHSTRGIRIKVVRRPRKNPKKDPLALVQLLWRNEAIALLEERNAARGFRGKARWIVWDKVCELFNVNEIAKAVRRHLKARAKHQVPV